MPTKHTSTSGYTDGPIDRGAQPESFRHHNTVKVNRFDYDPAARTHTKYEEAIIGCVKMLGWMSLKDSDHNVSGINAAACKRILKEAVETRKAADTLIAAGVVTLLGTWPNGIAVGPGEGFTAVTAEPPVVVQSKKRRARTVKAGPVVNLTAERAAREEAAAPSESAYVASTEERMAAKRAPSVNKATGPHTKAGGVCAMRYDEGASCPVTLAPVKPRVRYIWPVAPIADDADAIADAAVAAITGEDYSAQPQPAPTPIRATPATYTPAVGDTVFIILRHEDGRTTDRVIDVQRVTPDGSMFRGYDRRYRRTRNFYAAQVAHCERWDGAEVYDHNGNVAVAAA